MEGFFLVLTLFAAIGCGLNGGVFFAFSTFVMPALARLPAAQGIAAMQSINVTAVRPPFMTAFFGTAAVCVLLGIGAVVRGAGYLLTGSLLYLIGTIGVTMVCNVPRNNALARLDADGDESSLFWARFVAGWTAWNHVRAGAALAAAAAFTWVLVSR